MPLSASSVLFGLSVLGVPLHQMSVTGLIIALGLLIDNAIVTVDEVHRQMHEAPRLEAIRRTIRHLFVPLLGSTLTTVLAFLPILLLSGSVGEFIRTMALSVILAIVSSFAVAMTLLPALTALFGRAAPQGCEGSWWQCGVSSRRLAEIYRRMGAGAVRRPILGVAAASLLPVLGFTLAPTLENQFFPTADRDQFYLQMWLPSETSIDATRARALEVETVLDSDPAVRRVDWVIGGSAPAFYYNMLMNQDGAGNYAQALVHATDRGQLLRAVPELQQRLDAAFPPGVDGLDHRALVPLVSAGLMGIVGALAVGLGFLAIWMAGFPYGFMAMIGTAGLIGVAINDSIVVLAALRARPEAAAGDVGAITDEVLRSSRHVFSTTLTTVGGFLPLLLSGGGFWPPLAVVIAGGVADATLLALFFIPSAYAFLSRQHTVSARVPRLEPALASIAMEVE